MSDNQRDNDKDFNNRQWRGDNDRRSDFGNRGRRFDRDDRRGGRDFDRDDRGRGGRRFDQDDRRGGRRFDDDRWGGRRFERDDRGRDFGDRRRFDRDDNRGGRRFDRDDRNDRGGRRFDRDNRDFGNRGRRFDRDDRGREGHRFDQDDRRGGRRFDDDRRGGRRFERDDRGRDFSDRRRFDRDDNRGGRRFDRDDRNDSRGDRRGRNFDGDRRSRNFDRDDRRGGRFDRDDRRRFDDNRGGRGGRGFDRDDRRGNFGDRRRFDRDDRSQNFEERDQRADAHDRFDEEFAEKPNQVEGLPIPEGLEGKELDAQAYATLATLGEHSQEEVAKLLVMAGQLIDLDPERAYTYAQAAVKRAGRVDIVREAAALTAYATGRYQEALREVRAVRRMRNDYSLRAVEADSERGLGKPEKAIELIEETDLSQVDLAEQVELVLVAAGARSDMGENEAALILVDNALAKLGPDADDEFLRRLMSAKADHLRSLGRAEEAAEVEASMPAEEEDNDILDLKMMAESDVDDLRSDLKGSEEALSERYDTLILDLDGVCYAGQDPIPYSAEGVSKAVEGGMKHVFVTNNSSRTRQAVADQLSELGFPAEPEQIMTSALDVIGLMKEDVEEGANVFVIGGQGLRDAVTEAGFVIVESADDKPAAVVQGFDKSVDWAMMSEGALAINAGAKFFATNLDASLPVERGFALGNGALVRAVRHATKTKPKASGKPFPGIFEHAIEMIGGNHAVAVGDRLDTDVAGALAASIPTMHVLTGVNDARDVILADRGLRPQLVHLDMRGLNEPHPRPRHHKNGTWTCGVSQEAKVVAGHLTLDGIVLPEEGATVTLDSYRALIAAAWDHAKETDSKVNCPPITVVENDDEAGILERPEPVEQPDQIGESDPSSGFDQVTTEPAEQSAQDDQENAAKSEQEQSETDETEELPEADVSDDDLENVDVDGIPEFLPGEEDLADLMEETKHLEDEE